jgi:hypothetical protein
MKSLRAIGWVALVALCAGCASGPRATGTLVGSTAGAAAGGLIGARLGKGGGNAALVGAGLGALLGMLIGDLAQQQQSDRPSAPPPSTRRSPTSTSSPAPRDPSKGEFINGTTWLVHVYIDPSDPENLDQATPILLRPVQRVSWGLDAGQYRIVARAYSEAQTGERLMGRFDRTIQVDTQRAGWFLEFGEEDFR